MTISPPTQIWPEDFVQSYHKAGYWRGETFPQMLDRLARTHGTREAVTDGGRRWSYAELANEAATLAAGFQALALVPGERVLMQLPNQAEFLLTAFALFHAGLIPVFALPAHREAELTHLAAKSGARAFVTVDQHDGYDHRVLARHLCAQNAAIGPVVVVGDAGGFIPFDSLRRAPVSPVPRNPSDVALIQISGGSTGLPKLIPRTHNDYIYSFTASGPICGLNSDSVYLAALPVAHNFPMSSPGVFGTLAAGGRVVMCPAPAPDIAFPLIAGEGVTITGLVPPLALLWAQAAGRGTHDLSSLRVVQVGGAKLPPEGAARIRAQGWGLQQVFGMAEGLVNYTRLDDPEEVVLNTQGRPISPADEVLILGDDGAPVAPGLPGHLLARGPYTIRAYHDEPAANARSFTADGFYRTGDIVVLRADGNLEVRGRASDHINRAGEKISAEEVEDHLLAHPAVFDAAVVALPDRFLGERAVACVVLREGASVDAAALRAFVRRRGIAAFKVPDQIRFTPGFATTAVGKTSRKDLRAALRKQLMEHPQ